MSRVKYCQTKAQLLFFKSLFASLSSVSLHQGLLKAASTAKLAVSAFTPSNTRIATTHAGRGSGAIRCVPFGKTLNWMIWEHRSRKCVPTEQCSGNAVSCWRAQNHPNAGRNHGQLSAGSAPWNKTPANRHQSCGWAWLCRAVPLHRLTRYQHSVTAALLNHVSSSSISRSQLRSQACPRLAGQVCVTEIR